MKEPSIAVAVLQWFYRDETLVGDILEEYDLRRSRAWLWRQVAVAVMLRLPYGMVRFERQTRKMPMPIGGLGFIAVVALITVVAPGAWWFIAAGAFGGVALAWLLVIAARHRLHHEPPGPRHILLSLLLVMLAAGAARAGQGPKPAVPIDPDAVEEIVDAIRWTPNAPRNPILLSKETCADPAYLPMWVKRIELAGLPNGEAAAVKKACDLE